MQCSLELDGFVPLVTKVTINSSIITSNMAVLDFCFRELFDLFKSSRNRLIGIAPRNKQAKTDGCNVFKQKKVTNQSIAFRIFKLIIEYMLFLIALTLALSSFKLSKLKKIIVKNRY